MARIDFQAYETIGIGMFNPWMLAEPELVPMLLVDLNDSFALRVWLDPVTRNLYDRPAGLFSTRRGLNPIARDQVQAPARVLPGVRRQRRTAVSALCHGAA